MAKGLQVNQVSDAFVTVPGFYYIEESQQGGDVTLDSTTWKQFQPTAGTHSVEIPVAGAYKFGLTVHVLPNTALASYQFRIILNEGEASEVVVGGDLTWTVRINDIGQYQPFTFAGFADLPAGTHTYTVEGKRTDGSGTLTLYSQAALFRQPQVIIESVSGSGAGGTLVGTYQTSGDTVINTQVSSSYTTVFSETVNTAKDDSILLTVRGRAFANGGGNCGAYLRFKVDGNLVDAGVDHPVNTYVVSDTDSDLTLSEWVTGLSAGQHTIVVECAYGTNDWTFREGGKLFIARFVGGLIPYQQDGTDVIAAPRAVDVIAPLNIEDTDGKATLSWLGSGSDGVVATRTATANVSITDSYIHGASPYTVQSEDIEVREGEQVLINYVGYFRNLESGTTQPYVDLLIDGSIVFSIADQETTQWHYDNMSFSYVSEALTAGTHTISIELSKYQASNSNPTMYGNELHILQFRGGYSTPQNLPLIDGVSGDTFNMIAAAGASSDLWIPMNDGSMLRVTAPYAMDIGTNGAGGLEGSLTVANSTTYFIYAVPHSTNAGEAMFVLSDKDPNPNNDNGPANYSVWAYCGFLFYRSTSDLRPVHQNGANFHFADPTESALQIYFGSAVDPPQTTWYTFSTASAAGGVGTQRDISAALPMSLIDSIDLQAGCDSDAGDQIAFYVDAREVAWATPSNWKNLGVVMFHLDNSQRAVTNRQNIPVHSDDVKFMWSGRVGNLFDWSMSVRGYTDKYLTGRGVGQAGVLRDTERIDSADNTSAFTAMVGINRVDISAGSFIATLPTAASATGQSVKFLITDMDPLYELTVDGDGSETIDGVASVYLQIGCSEFYSDGTVWYWLKKGQQAIKRASGTSKDFISFTEDGDWHALDVTSVIPNAAYGKLISVYGVCDTNASLQLASVSLAGNQMVYRNFATGGREGDTFCDSSGNIHYRFSGATTNSEITIRHWWVDV